MSLHQNELVALVSFILFWFIFPPRILLSCRKAFPSFPPPKKGNIKQSTSYQIKHGTEYTLASHGSKSSSKQQLDGRAREQQ